MKSGERYIWFKNLSAFQAIVEINMVDSSGKFGTSVVVKSNNNGMWNLGQLICVSISNIESKDFSLLKNQNKISK